MCKVWVGLCHRGVTGTLRTGGVGWCIEGLFWEGRHVLSMSLTNLKSLARDVLLGVDIFV